MERIASLGPGLHYVCGHLAIAGDEIASVCSPGFPARAWAEEYRVSDLEAVTAPRVRAACEAAEVQLVSLEEVLREERSL